MIIEYIRYRVGIDEDGAALEAAYAEASKSLDASAHCLRYELARGVEERDRYTLRIRPFIGQIEEMKHYEATAVTG